MLSDRLLTKAIWDKLLKEYLGEAEEVAEVEVHDFAKDLKWLTKQIGELT